MSAQIPLLTDVIEIGDRNKKDLHLEKTEAIRSWNKMDDSQLSALIDDALNKALPDIKRRLHQQLFNSLKSDSN